MRESTPMVAMMGCAASVALALLVTCSSFGAGPARAVGTGAGTATHTLTDLGTLGGTTIARDLNDSGEVVGQSQNTSGLNRAFLWENGKMTDLGTLGGPPTTTTSAGRGIDDSGRVVGLSRFTTGNQVRASLWEGGQMTNLGALTDLSNSGTIVTFSNSEAWQINDSGVAVGRAFNNAPAGMPTTEGRAVLWENGKIKNLGVSLGTPYSEAWGINDSGQVVGEAGGADQQARAFLYDNRTGGVTDLDASLDRLVFPYPYSEAVAINDLGQVVGWSYRTTTNVPPSTPAGPEGKAFLYDSGATVLPLNPLEGDLYSRARDIDGTGRTVGWSRGTDGNERVQFSAVLWKDGEVTDLNGLIPPDSRWRRTEDGTIKGWKLTDAYAINGSGQIVGAGFKDGRDESLSQLRSFLLTPDTTKPRIECGTADDLWHAENVSIPCTASDSGVGLADRTDASFTLTTTVSAGTETADAETGSYEVCDAADNCAIAGPIRGNKIDRDPPETTASSASYNEGGWTDESVTVTLEASDGGSGVRKTEYDLDGAGYQPYGGGIVVSGEGSHEVSYRATDRVGNVESPAGSFSVNIDETAPTVDVTGVSAGADYVLGSEPAAGCSTTDGLSGVARQATLSITGGPLGSVTATCGGALDTAGNAGSASVTYSVVYDFRGFFSPVDNPNVLNRAKAGSAIPVKFSLGGDRGLDVFAEEDGVGFPRSTPVPCNSTDPVDAVERTVSAGSSGLSYDATTDRYTYVWKTRKDWTGCRQLVVRLDDGKEYRANFEFAE